MALRFAAAVTSAMLVTFAARDARADDPIDLTWTVPPECPTREEVLRRVAGQGLTPGALAAPTPRVRAIVRGNDAQGWLLSLTFQQPIDIEARSFEGSRCETVTAAAVHSLRLLLEAPDLRAPAPSPPRPAPARTAGVQLVARAEFGFALGAVPSPTPTLRGTLGAAFDRWRLEGSVGGGVAEQTLQPTRERFSVRAWDLGLRGCYAVTTGALQLRPCVSLDAGVLNLTPSNPQLLARDGFWFGAGASLHFTWWFMSRVGVTASASVGLNAAPIRFNYRDVDGDASATVSVLAQPVVYGGASVGVEARLF